MDLSELVRVHSINLFIYLYLIVNQNVWKNSKNSMVQESSKTRELICTMKTVQQTHQLVLDQPPSTPVKCNEVVNSQRFKMVVLWFKIVRCIPTQVQLVNTCCMLWLGATSESVGRVLSSGNCASSILCTLTGLANLANKFIYKVRVIKYIKYIGSSSTCMYSYSSIRYGLYITMCYCFKVFV